MTSSSPIPSAIVARSSQRYPTSTEIARNPAAKPVLFDDAWTGYLFAGTLVSTRTYSDAPEALRAMPASNLNPWLFVDLFAGCGGLSLGLSESGWRGCFAVEKDPMAFETFRKNLVDGRDKIKFAWPEWLHKQHWAIDKLLEANESNIKTLKGTIRLIAGGPPCQGFSFAGRRRKADPRNMLFTRYVRFVELLQPWAIVVENVPGMSVAHGAKLRRGKAVPGRVPQSFSDKLIERLDAIGYVADKQLLDAAQFGVPQKRPRLFVVGFRKDIAKRLEISPRGVFQLIEAVRVERAEAIGLDLPVSAKSAISDLQIGGHELVECKDPDSRSGFKCLQYVKPTSTYQKLMHGDVASNGMNSMRLARHRPDISARFQRILDECPKGVRMNDSAREEFGLLKHRIYPMAVHLPAPTMTTLPDDVLHYCEPRILTVREIARLQSFPDWFEFCGKYTTGGMRRTKECPRYTQVGNAVPPLLAEAVGMAIRHVLDGTTATRKAGRKQGRTQVLVASR